MKYKKLSYHKILVFFTVFIIFTLMSGCGGTIIEPFGTIDINSTPSGTRVYLDGVDTGQATPTIFNNVGVGEHTVRLSLPHYRDWEGIVTVVAEQTTYLNALLIWAPVDTITIQPDGTDGKDAYAFDNQPTWNFNNQELTIGISSILTTWRSYLQFDLSSLPPDAVMVDARLGLYYHQQSGATSLKIGLYEVKGPWGEDTIAWDNQPASSNVEEDVTNIPASPTNDFVYWYIYDLVKGWTDGSIANYGMLLRDDDESSNNGYVSFYSSDYGTGINRPKLVIDYYTP